MNKDFMKNEREDNAKIKRVELHAHTKMSKRDAVVSARELIMTAANRKVAELSVKLNKPLVATCDAHSLNPINALCRNIIKKQMCYQNWNMEDSAYLRTTDEMLKEFDYLGENLAYEAVVTNTHKIADMVERLKPLPDCLYAKTIPNSDDEIKKIIDKNIHRLYGEHIPKIVNSRFDKELSYILSNGICKYMTELYGESKVLGATDIVKYHERQFYSYLNNSMTHLSKIYPFMKKS